jgi:protein disulfide-isomerase A1
MVVWPHFAAQWILRETLPLVDELSADTVQKYVEKGTPFALFFYDSNKEGKLADARAITSTVAADFRHQLFFLLVDARDLHDQLEAYGLQASPLPALVIDKLDGSGFIKYREKSWERTALSAFFQDFVDGKLKPGKKSQDIDRSRANEPVYALTYAEWDELVVKRNKAVLVEFYAPWCGFCKSFKPVYEAVGKKIQETALNKTVLVAAMDMTQNELPAGAKLDGYPTVLLYPRETYKEWVAYEGDYTSKDVLAFIREHVSKGGKKRKKPKVMTSTVNQDGVSSPAKLSRDDL